MSSAEYTPVKNWRPVRFPPTSSQENTPRISPFRVAAQSSAPQVNSRFAFTQGNGSGSNPSTLFGHGDPEFQNSNASYPNDLISPGPKWSSGGAAGQQVVQHRPDMRTEDAFRNMHDSLTNLSITKDSNVSDHQKYVPFRNPAFVPAYVPARYSISSVESEELRRQAPVMEPSNSTTSLSTHTSGAPSLPSDETTWDKRKMSYNNGPLASYKSLQNPVRKPVSVRRPVPASASYGKPPQSSPSMPPGQFHLMHKIINGSAPPHQRSNSDQGGTEARYRVNSEEERKDFFDRRSTTYPPPSQGRPDSHDFIWESALFQGQKIDQTRMPPDDHASQAPEVVGQAKADIHPLRTWPSEKEVVIGGVESPDSYSSVDIVDEALYGAVNYDEHALSQSQRNPRAAHNEQHDMEEEIRANQARPRALNAGIGFAVPPNKPRRTTITTTTTTIIHDDGSETTVVAPASDEHTRRHIEATKGFMPVIQDMPQPQSYPQKPYRSPRDDIHQPHDAQAQRRSTFGNDLPQQSNIRIMPINQRSQSLDQRIMPINQHSQSMDQTTMPNSVPANTFELSSDEVQPLKINPKKSMHDFDTHFSEKTQNTPRVPIKSMLDIPPPIPPPPPPPANQTPRLPPDGLPSLEGIFGPPIQNYRRTSFPNYSSTTIDRPASEENWARVDNSSVVDVRRLPLPPYSEVQSQQHFSSSSPQLATHHRRNSEYSLPLQPMANCQSNSRAQAERKRKLMAVVEEMNRSDEIIRGMQQETPRNRTAV